MCFVYGSDEGVGNPTDTSLDGFSSTRFRDLVSELGFVFS